VAEGAETALHSDWKTYGGIAVASIYRRGLWVLTFAMLVLSPVVATHAAPTELPYLYERVSKAPAYASTLRNLLNSKSVPPWVREYLKSGNGVDRPGVKVSADNVSYELYSVCQPHNCGGNFLYVLYQNNGKSAVALITVEEKDLRYFGNPTASQQKVLLAATKS
jgi:hypothetical protein